MIEKEDLRLRKKLVGPIPSPIRNFLFRHDCYIAGGAVRSVCADERIRDYDIYLKKDTDIQDLISKFKLLTPDSSVDTELCKSFKIDGNTYQFITDVRMMISSTQDIFNMFDYTVCMAAYSCRSEVFYFHDSFFADLSERRLVFNVGTLHPIASMFRSLKFIKRGYKLGAVEMIKIALSIQRLHIASYAELKHHLLGIDTLFLKDLTDALGTFDEHGKKYDFDKAMEFINSFAEEQLSSIDDGAFKPLTDIEG